MDILTSEELEHYTRNKIIMNDKYKRENFYRYHSFIENIQNDESMGDLIPKESIDYKNYLKHRNKAQRTYNSFNNIFYKTPEHEIQLFYRSEISSKTIYRKNYNTYKQYQSAYKNSYIKILKENNIEYKEKVKKTTELWREKNKGTEEYKQKEKEQNKRWREKNKDNVEYKERKRQRNKAYLDKIKDTEEYKQKERERLKKYREKIKI